MKGNEKPTAIPALGITADYNSAGEWATAIVHAHKLQHPEHRNLTLTITKRTKRNLVFVRTATAWRGSFILAQYKTD